MRLTAKASMKRILALAKYADTPIAGAPVEEAQALPPLPPINTRQAFVLGYDYGVRVGLASVNDAQTAYPALSFEGARVFCNGAGDGYLGDTWRIDGAREVLR